MTLALPLAGLRVVDSADGKGELCARLLADLGADVIRVEPVGGGASRSKPPLVGDASLHFAVRNANKKGVVLDRDDPSDQHRLWELLGSADVWIETSSPRWRRERRDLDPAEVAARLPELVIASITDFGQDGPYRDFEATDAVMLAMSWMLYKAGVPELPPMLPPGELASDIASITGAFAVLTAFLHRLRTGRGQHIDLSVIEAVQQTSDWGLPIFSSAPPGTVRQVRNGGGRVSPILPCKDGWIRPSLISTPQWRSMRAWLGDPDMFQDDHWDQVAARVDIFDDLLRPMLEEFFADKTMLEASAEGQRRRIPVTPVLRPGEVLTAAQYETLGTFIDGTPAPGLRGRLAAGFYILDDTRIGYRTPPPPLSRHDGPLTTLWDDREPLTAPLRGSGAAGPFDGVRVLDFGTAAAAPEIARLLGEYGADAIKVENSARPDIFRESSMSPQFASTNRSKRSLAANLNTVDGLAIAKALIQKSDIVVENLPTGVMSGLGLGWDVIHQLNPDVIMISSQTMGSRGPWTDWRGYGTNTQPPTGMTYLWGFPNLDELVPASTALPDHVTGRLGAAIAAACVIGRPRRKQGARIEIVQAEVVINLMSDLLLKESIEPGSVKPQCNRSEQGAPWGVYPCQGDQRWCVISCRDDADWVALTAALDHPAWAVVPEYQHVDGRRDEHDAIDAHLAAWTAARTDDEVMSTLQAYGVPAGKMMYPADVITDPHLLHRGYIRRVEHPSFANLSIEGPAFHAPALTGPITVAAPALGQHTRNICVDLLGLTDGKIDQLIADGALKTPEPLAV